MVMFIFIGGGSAGTAGGFKATTFFVLFAIVTSKIMGQRDAGLFQRRLKRGIERQALPIMLRAGSIIFAAMACILAVTSLDFDDAHSRRSRHSRLRAYRPRSPRNRHPMP